MRVLSHTCLSLALLLLAACSSKESTQSATEPVPQVATPAPTADQAPVVQTEPEETCTNEPRTDESDKRPRCGGMAAVPVAQAYRIALDNGESFTACDISKPFSGKIGGGMITMSFTPGDDRKSGKVAWHFAGGGGMADTTYSYTLSGPEEKMTGSFQSTGAVRGQGSGRTVSAAAHKQSFSSTWTRIEDCDK